MKTLYIDIETSPNVADVWGLYNQTISLSQLRRSSSLLCFAYKWGGEETVYFQTTWDSEDYLSVAWNILEEADVVVTYNGDGFDIKTLNREFLEGNFVRPAPFISVDLYKVIKKNFRFQSNKLQFVASTLGLGEKLQHTGHKLWVDVMAGDVTARQLMIDYCIQDVLLTEQLHSKLRGWINIGPNVNLFENTDNLCPYCGQNSLTKRGFRYNQTGKYQRYQCGMCGSWSQSTKREKEASSVKTI